MDEYDTVPKALLQGSENTNVARMTGLRIARWLPGGFPEVQQTRVGLLGEAADEARTLGSVGLKVPTTLIQPCTWPRTDYGSTRNTGAFRGCSPSPSERRVKYSGELIAEEFFCRYTVLDARKT
jgi:hypothetical protein